MTDEPDLVPGMPFHYYRPPKWIARCIVGLFVLGALNLAGLTMSLLYDLKQQEYIMGRGDYRDAEAQRIEQQAQERIRAGLCDLLDQLPASPLLDVPRGKYGCGPGLPPAPPPPPSAPASESRTPAASTQQQSRPERPQLPGLPPAPGVPRPPASSTPTQQQPAPATPPPAAEPAPEPVTEPQPDQPPPDDPEPVTDPVCRLIGVCL